MEIFFFFRQKTAYEMRISDWSSDVCSSDLLPAQRKRQLRGRAGPGEGRVDVGDEAVGVVQPVPDLAGGVTEQVVREQLRLFGADAVTEIGRASCRERVCQYV